MFEYVLPSGDVVLIDAEDFERVNQFRWHLSDKGYVVTYHKNKKLRMHRVVMGAIGDQIVDHKNRTKLDNRKSNLRITDRSGNARNRGANLKRGNAHKGVYLNAGRYEARIKVGNTPHYLGRFDTADAAAVAYNTAAIALHGDMACLNQV